MEGEAGYRVVRDGVLITELGAEAVYNDDSSPDIESYIYRVEVYNGYSGAGSSTKDSESCVY